MAFPPIQFPSTDLLATIILALSPVVAFILLYFQPTTYGKLDGGSKSSGDGKSNGNTATAKRQQTRHWLGPMLPSKYSWMIFESPCWMWVVIFMWKKNTTVDFVAVPLPNLLLLGWFLLHYIHRAILYPLKQSSKSKMPLGISAFALYYTTVNGYVQAYDLLYQQEFPNGHATSWQFVGGMILAIIGFAIAYQSDHILLELKTKKDSSGKAGYQIPKGFLFDHVSSPHYLGEILEWTGYCVACNYSLASVSFLMWTAANLIPRAWATHQWYRMKFREEYDDLQRRAIIPFVF